MIYMIYMIFDGLAEALGGLRWVRRIGDWNLARSRGGAKGAKGDRSFYPLGAFWWLMAAGPIERNFIPHSTTLARGRMTGNRLGVWVGCGFGRFWFGANACLAFGECVRLGTGSSREAAEPRRGPKGDGFGHD